MAKGWEPYGMWWYIHSEWSYMTYDKKMQCKLYESAPKADSQRSESFMECDMHSEWSYMTYGKRMQMWLVKKEEEALRRENVNGEGPHMIGALIVLQEWISSWGSLWVIAIECTVEGDDNMWSFLWIFICTDGENQQMMPPVGGCPDTIILGGDNYCHS